ncbi:helix-turn-helix domain-containing protein [Aquimarina celericrescens]|uniref:Helix-turn-helix domain-containing protein n=1 Tax=Aquimarina celericrescens TaxID=1964542 RepID=A0ABW5B484_9FLAO|nr:AraC family transcriptional regulator [Aquimarina celericrescens]
MNILDASPLLSTIVGLLLGFFIFFGKSGLGRDKKIRLVLSALVFLYAYTTLDYYLTINIDSNSIYSGSSYLFYHIIGFLFYYFILLFTRTEVNVKKWLFIIICYTFFRWTLFIPFIQHKHINELFLATDSFDFLSLIDLEYFSASLINIILLIAAFFKLKQTPLSLVLNKTQLLHFKWIKIVILINIILQLGSFLNTIVNTNAIENYEFYMKLETLLFAVFFFIMAYSMMYFPVFAFSGSFEDLPEMIKKKYANSSLSDSLELFQLIEESMKKEQLYLDYDIKLNTLANILNKSVHHISQAINENAHMGFSDYINQYRVEDAKKKLLRPNPETIYAISLDVGFNSKAAFYKAFKKNTKLTPTEFKKRHENSK